MTPEGRENWNTAKELLWELVKLPFIWAAGVVLATLLGAVLTPFVWLAHEVLRALLVSQ